jgi:hypothetical protein
MKYFWKQTALLFMAATMFTFASCDKENNEDDNSTSAIGGSLTGLWVSPYIGESAHGKLTKNL